MRVRVAVSFNGMVAGDVADISPELRPQVDAYIRAGLLDVIDHGEREAGPSEYPESDPGRLDERTEAGGPDGGEPGEDPVSG